MQKGQDMQKGEPGPLSGRRGAEMPKTFTLTGKSRFSMTVTFITPFSTFFTFLYHFDMLRIC